MRALTYLTLGLVVVASAGCSSGDNQVAVRPVTGQVIYDGKPAAGVQVFLVSTNAGRPKGAAINPHAVTGPDGKFEITTYEPGDGAPEGNYKAVLHWPVEDSEAEEPPDRLFGWYDLRHTTLSVKVTNQTSALDPFKLQAVHGPPPQRA